jgi:hexosaminidase
MKRLFFLALTASLLAAAATAQLRIVPQPVEAKTGEGFFRLSPSTAIGLAGNNAEATRVANMLSKKLSTVTGYTIPVTGGAINMGTSNIILSLNTTANATLGNEGYQLKVGNAGTQIIANTPAGLFYGMQTFLQLLPAEVEGGKKVENLEWKAPAAEITDYPRFGWRGLMLDVSRHFFTKDEVKRYIDDMAKYKFNLLHWHLTDDQGWRIEIKSYPRLTEVGAWNVKKEGRFNYFSKPEPDEPRNYGGFYTQEDIKEIVQYAKERFVNVLPEIDVPGHSMAAIAAYPELTSTPGTYQVNSGEKFMEWPPSGHFYGLIDNALNPANEKVYTFLDKVFGEVAQLFPFEYLHMGGDETARNFWEKSEDIKKLMAKEKLKNLDEVQSYFVKRVTKIVNSKGKKLIGWDEILQGGLAPGAAVMSWQGMKGGIEAAKQGHEVVMSPQIFTYIDYMQGDRLMEPLVYASLRLKKTYEFDPLPEGVDAKYIKGGQANLWTEQVFNMRQAQYMTWPRGFAIAEAVWSPKAGRNFANFVERIENQFPKLDQAQTKWAPSLYEPDVKAAKGVKNVVVTLVPEVDGLDMHYSFDNSWPDQYYPKYTAPIEVPKDADKMRIVTFKNGKQVGRFMTVSVEELKSRAK